MSFSTPAAPAVAAPVIPNTALHAVVDLSAGDVIVAAADAILHAVYINVDLSNDTVAVQDGNAIPNVQATIPAKAEAGSDVNFANMGFTDGITLSPGGSASGEVTVVYSLQ